MWGEGGGGAAASLVSPLSLSLSLSRHPGLYAYVNLHPSFFASITVKFEFTTYDDDNDSKKINTFFFCWFSHDVTRIQTTKLSILLRSYFHGVLEQLKTNFQTNFRFKRVLGFVIECA